MQLCAFFGRKACNGQSVSSLQQCADTLQLAALAMLSLLGCQVVSPQESELQVDKAITNRLGRSDAPEPERQEGKELKAGACEVPLAGTANGSRGIFSRCDALQP